MISAQPPVGPLSMAEIGRVLEGRRLGAYQLERFVGGGGMGAVFRALDTTLDRIVAVKVLSRQQSADEEMLRRFRNEAQSAARLDHENIGRVHAVGSEDGWHFIVFEFIEGTNLRDLVREQGAFDVPRTLNVAIQVADALEHASDREVVHRDIKPSNIIITPAGRARLVDMGLARLHQVEAGNDLTASGMTLGTFDYISPEQARDPRSADVRSDLYSLGCTIFFTLAGRPPFADGTMVQKLLQHQQEPPPPIEALRPDVPPRLAAAISRLMAKDPADRYQRPADLIADLLGIAEQEGIDVSASRSSTVAAVEPAIVEIAERASPLPWMLPVAGLALTVGWLWWTSPAARRPLEPPPPDAVVDERAAPNAVPDAPAPAAPWRVVDVPSGERDTSSLAEAVRRASPGEIIELAYDGIRDEPAIASAVAGLTVRAAAGSTPEVRFIATAPEDGPDGSTSAAWSVAAGTLSIERIQIVLVASGFTADQALFSLGDGAMLACTDARLEIRAATDTQEPPVATSATLIRAAGGAADRPSRSEVQFGRTLAVGVGDVLHVSGDRQVGVVWSGGRCAVAGAFLVAQGGTRRTAPGPSVSLSLADATFACQGGFARLIDSPARPVLPSLRAFADACRFALPDGTALLEQTGIEQPDRYRDAVDWLDGGSRYEGSGVFRRIDGAAERVEADYASAVPPLAHTTKIDDDVDAWWTGDPDS
ncbi:MAG: protein kinase domain-containing protein [Planctomycetia bacterium]